MIDPQILINYLPLRLSPEVEEHFIGNTKNSQYANVFLLEEDSLKSCYYELKIIYVRDRAVNYHVYHVNHSTAAQT